MYLASCFAESQDPFPRNAVSVKKILVREEQRLKGVEYPLRSGGSCIIT